MTLLERLRLVLGERPQAITPLSGGCVSEVYRVRLAARTVVVKVDGDSPRLLLEAEMLRYLAGTPLPTPEVYYADEGLLVMEDLPGSSSFDAAAQAHAAELLAALHNISAETYGFGYDTLIGGLPQRNQPSLTWLEFFREQRLLAMTEQARLAGRLPERLAERLRALAAHLADYLDQPAHPSLVHGDVWMGNVLAQGGRITGFLDPALYYADAEIELAFIALFSTFARPFFERYQAIKPLRQGFERRVDVYNLYPLLVHVRLFGGGYVASLEATLRRLGA
jgi:fructosamine-3-kinase